MPNPDGTPTLEEMIAAANAEAAQGDPFAAQTPEPAKPITVQIGGKPVVFASEQELGSYVEQLQSVATKFRQPVAPPPAPVVEPPKPEVKEGELPENVKVYADKLLKDPGEALDFALREKIGFGLDDIKQMSLKLAANEAERAVDKFTTMHPEYDNVDENAQKIAAIMQARGYQWTPEGLEDAYYYAQRNGIPLKLRDGFQAQQMPQNNYPYPQQTVPSAYPAPAPQRAYAPPMLGRTSTEPDPSIIAAAENMPLEKLQQVIEQYERIYGKSRG